MSQPAPGGATAESTVTTVIMSLSGAVPTDVTISHAGSAEARASVRLGDLLCYLDDPATAAHIRRGFADWLRFANILPRLAANPPGPIPGTYPVGVIVRYAGAPRLTANSVPARPGIGAPAHLRVCVGPVVFQILDRGAYQQAYHAWASAARLLHS